MDDYVELKDLPRKAREQKIKKYIAEKKEALARYKERIEGNIHQAQTIAQRYHTKGRVVYGKVSKGLGKVQRVARKVEKRMPKKTAKSDSLFGDMSLNFGGFGGGGHDDFGMGSMFGSTPRKRKHRRR